MNESYKLPSLNSFKAYIILDQYILIMWMISCGICCDVISMGVGYWGVGGLWNVECGVGCNIGVWGVEMLVCGEGKVMRWGGISSNFLIYMCVCIYVIVLPFTP